MPEKTRASRRYLIAECDKLFRILIRERSRGLCEMCSLKGEHVHHIIKRRYLRYRWVKRNGMMLCPSCHQNAEEKQNSFLDMLRIYHSKIWQWYQQSKHCDEAGTISTSWIMAIREELKGLAK